MTLFDLTGKTALVTGARRGIGAGMALALAEAGADIIGASASMDPDGGELGAKIRAFGRSFEVHAVDFSDRAALKDFAAAMEERPIDILVNNAGMIKRMPATDHPEAWWDEVIETNLTAQLLLTQAVGRGILARGTGGKVIFTASLQTFQGGINLPGYAASKGGIGQLTMAFANEWEEKAFRSTPLRPATSRPTTRRPCVQMSIALPRSWHASRQVAGASRRTSPALSCFWRAAPQTMCPGRS